MKKKNVYVFGIGAAGSNILLNLIYSFPDVSYHVVDFDIVENRNVFMGTQPYEKSDLRRPKVQAISKICKVKNNINVSMHNLKINSQKDIVDLIEEDSLLIDCFDNAKSRNLFLNFKNFNVVHVGFSGDFSGAVLWNDNFSEMKESESDRQIDICEFSIARSFIMAFTGIASMAISEYLNKGKLQNIIFHNSKDIIKWESKEN